ncbi:hypothetical protein TNCV_3359301 [Trichonephila clavipes]|nr:hypothetical protein TNCV_3359301 [Trichonephila clavipes]
MDSIDTAQLEVCSSTLLYSLYTPDFPTMSTVDICLFADNAAILSQSTTPERVHGNLQKTPPKAQKMAHVVENIC